jgi:hypothetical protein
MRWAHLLTIASGERAKTRAMKANKPQITGFGTNAAFTIPD